MAAAADEVGTKMLQICSPCFVITSLKFVSHTEGRMSGALVDAKELLHLVRN